MNSDEFGRLEDAILDPLFPEIDIDLRQGRHVNRDEHERYGFLLDADEHLRELYARYGCELRHASDGYFYLLPDGSALRRRRLSAGEMLVGQALALMYLAPESVQSGGIAAKNQIIGRLAALVGEERLVQALGKGRKRSERVAEESVRDEAEKALRGLQTLGFVERVDDERVRLRPALLRFAEPVRGSGEPTHALEKLIADGSIVKPDGSDTDENEENTR